MSELSDAAEVLVLDWLLNTGTPTRPAACVLALDTTNTADTDTAVTISEPPDANGYDRQATSFNAGSSPAGTASLATTETFGPNITTNWGTINSVCIVDNVTYATGGLVIFTDLDTPRAMVIGDSLEFAATTGIVVTAA